MWVIISLAVIEKKPSSFMDSKLKRQFTIFEVILLMRIEEMRNQNQKSFNFRNLIKDKCRNLTKMPNFY